MARPTARRLSRAALLAAALPLSLAACATAGTPATTATSTTANVAHTARAEVVPGVEVLLADSMQLVRGKRVGLITNHSGMDRQRRSTIDLLHDAPGVRLVALFGPEHGIRGVAETSVESSVDAQTGLTVNSLYGATNKPTPEMLDSVDVLVYDIQDIGVRQYTFESTMTLAMQAAAEKGIPIVVLDRPNPITGTIIEGNILEPAFKSFVGIYPVASRHGMTMGELAKMYNAEQKIGANLTVVPMKGWHRDMWWDDYALPWVNPSPNIRSLDAEIHYPGTVFFEAINVSEGRGTDRPFEQIGAPWLNNAEVVKRMTAMNLPGVRFEALDIPVAAGGRKYAGETIKGVRFVVTNRETYRPIRTSLVMIDLIRQLHPTEFQWRGANQREPNMLTIERHGGTAKLRTAIEGGTLPQLLREWDADAERFRSIRAPYREPPLKRQRRVAATVAATMLLVARTAGAQTVAVPPPAPQNPSPMVEHARAHERIAPRELAGTKRTFAGPLGRPVELFVPASVRRADSLALVVHFLGGAFIPEYAVSQLGGDRVVAAVSLPPGSGSYEQTFSDPAVYDSLLAAIGRETSAVLKKPARFRSIALTGFSAGHAAIRAILRDSAHYARVDAVLLLDGMHTSYVPAGTVLDKGGALDTTNLGIWERLARDALAGRKRFLVTHSEIFPGTFASTTETADWLLDRLGLRRTPVLRWGPRGMQQLSEVRAGRFAILGFAGNSAPDHIDQFQGMPEFLRMLEGM